MSGHSSGSSNWYSLFLVSIGFFMRLNKRAIHHRINQTGESQKGLSFNHGTLGGSNIRADHWIEHPSGNSAGAAIGELHIHQITLPTCGAKDFEFFSFFKQGMKRINEPQRETKMGIVDWVSWP